VRRRLFPLLALALLAAGCGGTRARVTPTDAVEPVGVRKPAAIGRLAPVPAGTLAQPLQDAAAAPYGSGALLLGGLTAADASANSVIWAGTGSSRRIGTIPTALHDSAAVVIGSRAYLFGGGTATVQLDTILAIDPRSRNVQPAGRLPARSSDQAAAAIGGTAYVVGGYTGTRWLDTIVAWAPRGSAHVVAHLPTPIRYAAVTAVNGRLLIVGGSLPNGTASSAVYEFKPGIARVTQIGRLPAPTTHAAAAAYGSTAYVIGGRGASVGTPTTRIVAIDPETRKISLAGELLQPLSDLAAVTNRAGILLVGGHGSAGTVADITELEPRTGRVRDVSGASAGVPPLLDRHNVYAADAAGRLSPAVRSAKPYVYVPNSRSGTVDVIDQRTFKVVEHFAVGALPQHVVPAYDLKTLYVTNDIGNSLTPIDPNTGKPGTPIPVDDPYNMYFTPDGRYAIVVAERLRRLDFRDAHTFALHHSVQLPCVGADHMDFSANGQYAIVSCEFSSQLLKVDVAHERVLSVLTLRRGAMPQDVKLSPDGRVFYVADMSSNGVWLVDGRKFKVIRFMYTGRGAHGLYPSRDARLLYVTNRGEGSISLISFRTRRLVAKWRIPGGGSPDMGNVSADGKVLWLSGRWSGVVYAISTADGHLLARIPVGSGPHGLCVWPQPGRYSLGHTGDLR
jgi:YVTN family beta-propeller protein